MSIKKCGKFLWAVRKKLHLSKLDDKIMKSWLMDWLKKRDKRQYQYKTLIRILER
jgi:hypothetical protein